jgi:hypothetical protein
MSYQIQKPSFLVVETDANFSEHLTAHISVTRHPLTGVPEPP